MRKKGAELLKKLGITYTPEIRGERDEQIGEEVESDGIREDTVHDDVGRGD